MLLLGLDGLRVSEARSARVEDLSVERGCGVVMVTRQGGKSQTIPLAPRTAEAIDTLLDGHTTVPILSTSTGKPTKRPAVWRTLRRLAATAVPGKAGSLHTHDLRHPIRHRWIPRQVRRARATAWDLGLGRRRKGHRRRRRH